MQVRWEVGWCLAHIDKNVLRKIIKRIGFKGRHRYDCSKILRHDRFTPLDVCRKADVSGCSRSHPGVRFLERLSRRPSRGPGKYEHNTVKRCMVTFWKVNAQRNELPALSFSLANALFLSLSVPYSLSRSPSLGFCLLSPLSLNV